MMVSKVLGGVSQWTDFIGSFPAFSPVPVVQAAGEATLASNPI
jgi:hypothetical protein